MGDYKYPIFFNVPLLDEKLRGKIEKYFYIRRKSGGGECGQVESVADCTYKIAFKKQEDQQRVLQKGIHTLETPSGPLVVFVHQDPDSLCFTDSPKTSSKATSAETRHFHSTPGTIPCGQYEKAVQLDPYLIRYLTDSPQARSNLQLQLSSLFCSFQLQPEVEKMVVKGTPSVEQVSQLDSKINKVFQQVQGKYCCHYEADPLTQQVLQKFQATPDLQVYREPGQGFSVLVGQGSEVQKRLSVLQGQRNSVTQERVSTTLSLGKPQMCLLGKELEKDLKEQFPGVKISQTDLGQLVIEGPAEDVLSAREKVKVRASNVHKRVVAGLSLWLYLFVKTEGDEILAAILRGIPVITELGDMGLQLLSLSQNALDDAQKALLSQFSEEEVPLPDSPLLLPKLKNVLQQKELHLNNEKTSVQVRYTSKSVHLLGYQEAVNKLKEVAESFLKEHAIHQHRVALPYPDLSDCIFDLVALLDIDHSGIQLSVSASHSSPEVVLTGPRHLVTSVSARIATALDSLVQEIITIDCPGACLYFKGPGKPYLQVVGRTNRCLVQMKGPGDPEEPRYQLEGGICMRVKLGDITKENADALVNAANENLQHSGGVAAALSQAGGPKVQQASKELVQRIGRVAPGTAVETTPGKLPCKVLIHAVGPKWTTAMGRERQVKALLEKAVKEALELAERRGCHTLAMPCISSGIFGVPFNLCANAIVMAVRDFGRSPRTLHTVVLVDNNAEAVKAMQSACNTLLVRIDSPAAGAVHSVDEDLTDFTTSAVESAAASKSLVQVNIIEGNVEDQQVDALVSPMKDNHPMSSRVGRSLIMRGGRQFSARLEQAAQNWNTVPGTVDAVEADGGIVASIVFFLHCLCWDGNPQGAAVETLRKGLRNVFRLCDSSSFGSVAFPVMGTGLSLAFPQQVAAQVLLEEIQLHKQTRTSTTTLRVLIVIHPTDKHSAAAFQASQDVLHLNGFHMDVLPDQTSFFHSATFTQDEITVMMGRVKLQLFFGDIVKETTDVIVNSATFKDKQTGVSNALLTAAGQNVLHEFNQERTQADEMCTTQPGSLACEVIVHINACPKLDHVRKLCKNVLKFCEEKRYKSVAFPAVGAGAAGLAAKEVASSMFEGMASAVRNFSFNNVSLIRIVLLLRPVFDTFRSELESRLGQRAPSPTFTERSMQRLNNLLRKARGSRFKETSSEPRGLQLSLWRPLPLMLCVTGPELKAIRKVQEDLENILQKQLCEREIMYDELEQLSKSELDSLIDKVQALELSMKEQADAGKKHCVIQGLKEEVLEFFCLAQQMFHGALRRMLQEREEVLMGLSVQWLVCTSEGRWQDLELQANHILEQEYLRGGSSIKKIDGPGGAALKADIQKKQATDQRTGLTYRLKRVEVSADFKLPVCWDAMAPKESLKKVLLQQGTPEYEKVATDFLRTAAQHTIQKIERVQNTYLWRAYCVKTAQFQEKNGQGKTGEKVLYHGTSNGACNSIEKVGFNRSFAGQHGTAYGTGVYFAVEASYSASSRYCPADKAGLRYMYVAQVLTGRYTVGSATMKMPPSLPGSDPNDRFDSLVDNEQNPKMFVVFHDDQAYPTYLITFM